jgi:uracil-DNA glycosylase
MRSLRSSPEQRYVEPPRRECAALWLERLLAKLPLPHPSPRNQPWFKRNAWFEEQLLPLLQKRVETLLAS